MDYRKAIHDYIQSNRDNIVSMLSDLARIPSVNSEAKEGAMFGENCRDAILRVEELMKEIGLDTHTHSECAYTTGKTDGDEKTIGIFSHADVVGVVEEDWTLTKPFEPIEKDGFLVGRGVEDNKSGIVSAIWALKAMKHAGVTPKSTVMVYSGGNEECGMSDLEIFKSENAMPDFSIVPDNEYPVCRGEKGILRFWGRYRRPFENIVSITGGQSANIVLGAVRCEMKYSEALLAELKTATEGKDEYTLTVGERITLVAKGKSTHAAYSADSVNALWVLIQALNKCPLLKGDLEILESVEKTVRDPFSETLGLGSYDTEFDKTTCTNGIVYTVDGKLNLSFDTRYGTEISADDIISGYTVYFNSVDADCEETERDDGYIIPEKSPIISAMMQAWYDITGDTSKSNVSYGGTYARYLNNAVSIGTHFSLNKRPSLPDGHGGIHQPDEIIDIDGLLKSIEVFVHMILKADEVLHA